jgi:hypothetical protein
MSLPFVNQAKFWEKKEKNVGRFMSLLCWPLVSVQFVKFSLMCQSKYNHYTVLHFLAFNADILVPFLLMPKDPKHLRCEFGRLGPS